MKASASLVLAATLATISGSAGASTAPAGTADSPVVELRQYKIVAGQRDAFVALFDREFVDSQEADGMILMGQFRDLDDPNRFVWIRSFPDMGARLKSLNAFYFGPVWKKHRDTANPMLDDNDNVLLLKASAQGREFARPARSRAPAGAGHRGPSVVVATIYHLWKNPDEGFSAFFDAEVRPKLEAAGIPVLASLTPHAVENNFPRLPVRAGEKLFVWFSRFEDLAALADHETRLRASSAWTQRTEPALREWLERSPQVLRLEPTPRSWLR